MNNSKKHEGETISVTNKLLNGEPIDIDSIEFDSGEATDDSAEVIKKRAGEFAKAAGGLAGSIGRLAAKKGSQIWDKIEDEDFQEKVSSGFNSVANKLDEVLGSGTVVNVKGDGSVPIRNENCEYSVNTQQSKETGTDTDTKENDLSIDVEVMDDPEVYIIEGDYSESEKKKSALDYLKDEIRERADENKELKKVLEAERKRLEKARAEAKDANVFRKIKVIDNAISKKEIERDNKVIADLEIEEKEKISAARSERTKEIARKNKKPIAALAAALVVAVCGAGGITTVSHNIAESKDYSAAVEYIMAGDYDSAKVQLQDIEIDDSEALYRYTDYQSDIGDYKGRPDELLQCMQSVETEISNDDVAHQCKEAEEEIKLAEKIQNDIESLDTTSVKSISSEKIKNIESETQNLDERYHILLDTDKYELASKVLYNVENETAAGTLISDIDNLGEITLDSKDEIDRLRSAYGGLSSDDRKTILNYATLTSAETKYKSLRKKEDERIAAEKKAAEEAAEAEKKAAERAAEAEKKAAEEQAEQERLAAEAAAKENEQMVWIPKSGSKYHSNPNCSRMKNPSHVTLSQAKAWGYEPCSKCY